MATLTATRAAPLFPVFQTIGNGIVCAAWGTIVLAANPTAADIIQFCRVPRGATVLGGWVYGADLDTGTETLDFDIGWAANGDEIADPDGFGNLGVMSGDVIAEFKPVAGILVPFQGVLLTDGPKTFNAETILTATIIAAAATGGTGRLTMVAHYTCA